MIFTAAKAAELVTEGFEWEVSFFDFVDCFRREKDKLSLVQGIPAPTGDPRLDSLLMSMVLHLCDEADISAPNWAEKAGWLEKPWFVCDLSRLVSFCLVETPIRFKQNNIFVLANFMDRI